MKSFTSSILLNFRLHTFEPNGLNGFVRKLIFNTFFFLLICLGLSANAQNNCSVNAGANLTICGTTVTLQGSSSGTTSGTPTWTIISKPAGSPDPVFSNVNAYNPNVTGLTYPGNYTFQLSLACGIGSATSQVTITAPGDASTFTAGPDITNIPAATGVATLNGVIPAGYTASWTYYNLYNYEAFGGIVTTNATMTNTITATPTLTLTKKANNDIDPAYRAVLRITSINNPNCWYEDNAIVRFIPNINLVYAAINNQCIAQGATGNVYYINATTTSPLFSSGTANAAGNPAYGTTITMNVISQPSGGNIQYLTIENGRVYFSGINGTGDYVFTLTIANSTGSYTTPQITYRYNGVQPNLLSFIDAAHPNQIPVSTSGSSAGSVYCNMVNSTTPLTAYFKVNSADLPSVVTTVTADGTIPAGGSATISAVSGAGTMDRSVTFTPPAGGWKVGTYRFLLTTTPAGGLCGVNQGYSIHISDSARPNVDVQDMAVCYPGSGIVSATIPLPGFQGIVNASYFQNYTGIFDLSVVSKPTGSGSPIFQATNLRTLGNVSTVISNLDKPGEYVFKIKAIPGGSISSAFLDAEYACSGTSLEGTFSIFVTTQINANAGSDQTVVTTVSTSATLNGNSPGVATGMWSLVSKPSGAADPVIVTPTAYNSNVTGLNSLGAYTFRWTVSTGSNCSSFDDVTVNVRDASPGGVLNGLSYWYRADKNVSNTGAGTDVTGWTDMWSGTTVAQLGSNTLPKYVLGTSSYFNFNPGVNFTAVTQTIGNNTVQTLTSLNYDVFTLTKEGMTSTGANPRLFSIGMNNTTVGITNWDAFGISPNSNSLERRVYNGGTSFPAVNPGFSTAIPSIMYFRNTNTTSVKGLNGDVLGATVNYSAQGAQLGGHIFGNTIFSSNGSDNSGFVGNVGETIIYGAGTLSDTERRKVDSYLAIKYGITLGQVSTVPYLDTDGSVVWDGTTNTAYNNNIFGVSRDDVEVLEQKVSRSVNAAGANLTIATINDFVNPNQTASRTGFTNDKTYFLLGDNNITTTTLSSSTIAGIPMNRIQRAWLSQRQNTPGTMYLEANLAGYGSSFSPGRNVLMVVADDAAFTTNVKTVAGSYLGTKWVFNNSFDTDNLQRYITFATSCTQPGAFDAAGLPSTTGVSDLAGFTGGTTGWPANVPNGFIVVESKKKGFVITRVSSSAAITNPVEGMLVYDIAASCIKLYNGTTWNCLGKDCQ
ncbi:hypothetical protein [Pedobacter sp. ASV28]|uniref:beta strand repeat-containing protein n=1 Tax=Pedobacter sp. ASV28 TaxID=2795123 RepID=UPI0018EBE806|nr:hypothetical protein [Pedobacter sp. ASV28]